MGEIITRVPTNKDTPTKSIQRSRFGYRYAYARASEYKNTGDTGQDYLVIIENEKRLSFALCDGVSQSFYGDLAALSVGEALVDWLFNAPARLKSVELETNLTSYLVYLTEPVSKKIQEFILPINLPPMVQNALDKKRAIGSETTFIAGRVDLERNEIVLVWMGDSILRIWGTGSEVTTQLGDTFLKQERWSSLKGLVGKIHIFSGSIAQLRHFVVYSDGLKKLNSKMLYGIPSNHAIDIQIEEAGEDDISFFEFWLGGVPDLYSEIPGKVDGLKTNINEGLFTARWQQTTKASFYELEISTTPGERLYRETSLSSFQIPSRDLPINIESLRVRAWEGEEPGLWSESVQIKETGEAYAQDAKHPEKPPTIPLEPLPHEEKDTVAPPESRIPPRVPYTPKISWKMIFICLAAFIIFTCGLMIGMRISKVDPKHNVSQTETAESQFLQGIKTEIPSLTSTERDILQLGSTATVSAIDVLTKTVSPLISTMEITTVTPELTMTPKP